MKIPLWSLALTAVFLFASAANADEISMIKQPAQKGTIVSMSPTEVTVEGGRRKTAIPVNKIAGIRYDQEPLDLRMARHAINLRQYDNALNQLAAIKLTQVSRD